MALERRSQPSQDEFEYLMIRHDPKTDLRAVIAVHSTTLGPAAGGCRRWQYLSLDAAVQDAMRLARGMTYKNALADIPFGGGKSVILGTHEAPTEAQLKVFAGWVNELQGRYITAEDVGMGLNQIKVLEQHSPYVSGVGIRSLGGDPSPKTAYGVYLGLKTAAQYALGVQHLYGLRVAVQGLGAVGMSLCHWLARAGVELIVADMDRQRVDMAVRKYDAQAVSVEAIESVDADVFAPCALGGGITEAFARSTPVKVIAGAANNQLASPQAAEILRDRGVVYVPDFVLNAGGVISVAHEYMVKQDLFDEAHNSERWVDDRLNAISGRVLNILSVADETSRSPDAVACDLAERKLSGRCEGQSGDVRLTA